MTGGAGFIGSAVVKTLNDKGISQILIIDDLGSDEKWKNLVGKKFYDAIPIQETFHLLKDPPKKVGAFIHLGANSNTLETDASFLLENNYRYSVDLCKYALAHQCRFIYASSAATYGDGSLGFSDDPALLHQLKPLNMYGYSKHLFDLWALDRQVLDRIVGLKYFNVYGPNEYHKGRMASAILKFVQSIKASGKVQLFASNDKERFPDGEQCRDFIYVKDCAEITVSFLFNKGSGIYNVGCGESVTWNRFARSVFQAMGLEERIEYIPLPADLQGKYQNKTVADISKLRDILGEEVTFWTLERAVQDYVQNYILPNSYL